MLPEQNDDHGWRQLRPTILRAGYRVFIELNGNLDIGDLKECIKDRTDREIQYNTLKNFLTVKSRTPGRPTRAVLGLFLQRSVFSWPDGKRSDFVRAVRNLLEQDSEQLDPIEIANAGGAPIHQSTCFSER